MSTLDQSPVKVEVGGEPLTSRGRVIWQDGLLHVFKSESEAETFGAPDAPERERTQSGWVWSAGEVSWRSAGCKCGCRLCKLSQAKLLQRVGLATDAG